MGKLPFREWHANFKKTNHDDRYFSDFSKAKIEEERREAIDGLSRVLEQSSSRDDAKERFENAAESPAVLELTFMLFAYRDRELSIVGNKPPVMIGGEMKSIMDVEGPTDDYNLDKLKPEEAAELLDRVGFFQFYIDCGKPDLYGYLCGVEMGLDTHARKNRSGKNMENLVEYYIAKGGYAFERTYWRQAKPSFVENLAGGIKLPSNLRTRRTGANFDFVLNPGDGVVYIVEVNFYNSGGSKQSAIAGDYINTYNGLKDFQNVRFIWFTDGAGWGKDNKEDENAISELEGAYNVIEDLYCIHDLEEYGINGLLGIDGPRNTYTTLDQF